MASVARDKSGLCRIQYFDADGERKTIRIGRVSQRSAETVCGHIEKLVEASITGRTVENATAEWVAGLGEVLAAKLVKHGLIAPRKPSVVEPVTPALGAFIDEFIASRIDVKPGTKEIYQQIRRNLVEYFGEGMPIGDITDGDADEFRLDLIGQKLSEATVRRRCGLAKQVFRRAVKKRVIGRNPFEDLVSTAKGNPDRFYFVKREEIEAVLKSCTDAQWRLMIALSRFGGLRCPSEHLSLTWADVDWERNRIRVPSPKTEHHEGKGERIIPLFPELVEPLQRVFEEAEPGTVHVITRYRDTRANLRTQLLRIIRKAGLKPWPKPWQNMRSTRQTELSETFPIHVVCAWIGNTLEVAGEHYLQTTAEHFERAAKPPQEAAQNAAQKSSETDGSSEKGKGKNRDGDSKNAFQGAKAMSHAGPQGFEP